MPKTRKGRPRQVAAELRLLASIVESSDDAIFTKTTDGVITSWNKGAERLYGYAAAEILGRTPAVFMPSDRQGELARILERVRRGKTVRHLETVRTAKDGRRLDVSLTISPLRNARGRVVGASTIARDIGERRMADARFRFAVEAAPNAMIMVGRDGRIVLANARAEALFGYSREELKALSIEALVPVRFRSGHPGQREAFFAAPRTRPMGAGRDLFGLRKDGTEVPLEIGLNPVETPEGTFVLAAIVDITERKKLQRQGEIESLNRELETLLHVISHDLREPLRSIETFSRMVHDEQAERLEGEARDFLRRVVRAAERMRRLLDDVSSLAQARKFASPVEDLELEAVLEDVLARLDETIRATGARIVRSRPLPRVRGDAVWAAQALYNLVSNALKFRVPGRPPEVEIAPYRDAAGALGVAVRDRGPGVRAEDAERIFQLFQRAVGREVEGTGAGLAIVHAVAERHGGRAWVEPREGGGCQFILTFGPTGSQGAKP